MPSTSNRDLTLNSSGGNVTVTVSYNVNFTALELHLGTHGLRYRERIAVLGVDPAGSTTGTVLHNFPTLLFQPANGPRTRSITVPRASLNEDAGIFDADEIRARISLELVGMPVSLLNQFTDEEVLPGPVIGPLDPPVLQEPALPTPA